MKWNKDQEVASKQTIKCSFLGRLLVYSGAKKIILPLVGAFAGAVKKVPKEIAVITYSNLIQFAAF